MESLFTSALVIDLILGLIALEALALALIHRWSGKGLPPAEVIGFLLSGAFLMLALRAALTDAWWGWVGLWLTASLFAHLFDLIRRWRDH
ncbi:hypothetical protein L0E83_05465 [Marichromatium gracile]|uniref:Uncharacterized protein n=1 Tax=Marichromatium gracile TaxID=1048 RepID=A0A4R4AHT5_MARGR|nr:MULTISPECIES: hypothetical protein [Marichromatium]MBO8084464.1 hypothetical protein [Marichromatium sp.]MBK1708282.1 hypothetical protein [Marichromatium gracile]MCF1182887.1 hypothetical protein [Marichromatium gracile]RNE90799.1 hypothetical protein EBL84_05900 [Marichromatium sp. AB31]RNE94429.1 hypothetical protein EBL85_02055 [Marichromatium sp. AB32]